MLCHVGSCSVGRGAVGLGWVLLGTAGQAVYGVVVSCSVGRCGAM